MLLSVIVHTFVQKLFAGIEVLGCYQFRVTRNSDLFVDEEEIDDLRRALEGELAHRRYGAAVRLETSSDCPEDMVRFLLQQFALTDVDMYRIPGPVNLNRLSAIYDLVQRPDLKYPIFTPGLPKRLATNTDMFAVIRQNDILLHHPYQSFAPVMDFVRQAAADPQVLAIKQTLYRAGNESPVVDALVAAANAGKDVTVIVELRARFDEEANIELSNRLQEAGAHVMYGVVGYKTHAKVALIVRREPGGIRRYCHLGTGKLPPQNGAGVHGLRHSHLQRRHRPGCARVVSAAHQSHADAETEQVDPVAVRHARCCDCEDCARGRTRAGGASGARDRQDERVGGAAGYRGSLSCVVRGCQSGSHHPWRVRASAGSAGGLGKHQGALDRGAFSRTLTRVLFREWR